MNIVLDSWVFWCGYAMERFFWLYIHNFNYNLAWKNTESCYKNWHIWNYSYWRHIIYVITLEQELPFPSPDLWGVMPGINLMWQSKSDMCMLSTTTKKWIVTHLDSVFFWEISHRRIILWTFFFPPRLLHCGCGSVSFYRKRTISVFFWDASYMM